MDLHYPIAAPLHAPRRGSGREEPSADEASRAQGEQVQQIPPSSDRADATAQRSPEGDDGSGGSQTEKHVPSAPESVSVT